MGNRSRHLRQLSKIRLRISFGCLDLRGMIALYAVFSFNSKIPVLFFFFSFLKRRIGAEDLVPMTSTCSMTQHKPSRLVFSFLKVSMYASIKNHVTGLCIEA